MTRRGRSQRSYQDEIRRLKRLIMAVQWVQPTYNGAPSCSGCGQMKHHGCTTTCPVAAITGGSGRSTHEQDDR